MFVKNFYTDNEQVYNMEKTEYGKIGKQVYLNNQTLELIKDRVVPYLEYKNKKRISFTDAVHELANFFIDKQNLPST